MKPVERPISDSFRPNKQGARRHYGSHPYFTKRAWNVVQEYVKHFTGEGDTVLDPFGGSGVTAVESLVLRRKAVYVDISRWACFLARQTAVAPVPLGDLTESFLKLEARCRGPLEELWRRSNEDLKDEPVRHWYPRNVALPDNADVRLVEELFTPRMLHGLAGLRAGIDEVATPEIHNLLLLAFSSTLARINTTFLSAANRQETRGGSAIFSLYRYKVAGSPVELPLWEQFAKRFEKLVEAKHETNLLIGEYYREGQTASFRHGSATKLADIVKPESVDYIYTDPPYGAHISYLDLSTMWSAWLKLDISEQDRNEEVIEGGQLRKSRDEYQSLLSESIGQMAAALKDGGWLSLVFAHRDTSYWDAIVQACREAGLRYANTVVQPVGVVWSMHKKKNPLRVLSGELVLNFRKAAVPSPVRRADAKREAVVEVLNCCAEAIVHGAGAKTEELHHAVIPRLLETGLLAQFSRKCGDLTPLLEREFEFDGGEGKWHLRNPGRFLNLLGRKRLAEYLIARYLAKAEDVTAVTREDIVAHLADMLVDGDLISASEAGEILKRLSARPGAGSRHTQASHPLLF